MDESVEELENRISSLRAAVRQAVLAGEFRRASALRRDLRHAEQEWEQALDAAAGDHPAGDSTADSSTADSSPPGQAPGGPLLPLREQVHEALSLLQVPAAPRLIATVHEAFFATTFPTARLTSLRRDEERSFRTAPFARPYYICAALAADYLAPSRGLLAVSTWPMERRLIGSLSPRVGLPRRRHQRGPGHRADPRRRCRPPGRCWPGSPPTSADRAPGCSAAAQRGRIDPHAVIRAAQAELEVHASEDRRTRAEAARRAASNSTTRNSCSAPPRFARPPARPAAGEGE